MYSHHANMQEIILRDFASPDSHVASSMLLYQQKRLHRPHSVYSSFAGVGAVHGWLHGQGHCVVGATARCSH